MKQHKIISVSEDSIAWEMNVETGDILLSVNGQEIKDILDYRWLMAEENILVEIQKPDGEIWEFEIEKDSDEGLGLVFPPGSMGEDRRCANNCIFCFIDQQPPGLRESLYVKDDDPYQSFAMGNYITLTNLEPEDVDQIIKHRLSPMRVSVHAGDMNLRRMMMGSMRAGYLFKILERFCKADIDMHFQVVLCRGINDGKHLDTTIERLANLGKNAKSLAIVPVGLTRYRDGLYPLEGFTGEDAVKIIAQVGDWQYRLCSERGSKFVYLADEWYVLAGKDVPYYGDYDDFPQLDNGVGMMAHFHNEFISTLEEILVTIQSTMAPKRVGIVTGVAAGTFMRSLAKDYKRKFSNFAMDIHVIQNDFYGPGVTVSGLLTGKDIINQLTGKCVGLDTLFIPGNAFRIGTKDMLCGATLDEVSQALGVEAVIGSTDGGEFCRQLFALCGFDDLV
ncbi:MAG: DUF512 domain-containing protein [Defluviitaleaceae bacterium]|nr:DUF512 domain-containing protein [Defluviitaleaceae bacterium]